MDNNKEGGGLQRRTQRLSGGRHAMPHRHHRACLTSHSTVEIETSGSYYLFLKWLAAFFMPIVVLIFVLIRLEHYILLIYLLKIKILTFLGNQ